jgi:NADPH-dependent 2,4-dienoyl-CoA reductase/sulfur reductase-like enzyme
MNHHAVVIGAGPAGLATSRELGRHAIDHVVLERGNTLGHTWANLYDSLVLHTGKHLSSLPGLPFSRTTRLFPSRRDFLHYLEEYARQFNLPVRTGADVGTLTRVDGQWHVRTTAGAELTSEVVVIATGIVSNPYVASIAGREQFNGRVFHSVEYHRPDAHVGRRVLVVGAGNSAGEIAAELASAGAHVTIAVRSGARVVPRDLFGVPIQYLAVGISRLPRPVQRSIAGAIARASELARGPAILPSPSKEKCSDVPLIGFHLVDAIRSGSIRLKRGVAGLTAAGVRFDDRTEEPFDDVILATGYRAAVSVLGPLIRTDRCGFALRRGRVESADQPKLYFVGHNYDTRGALRNIAQDARQVGKLIKRGRPASSDRART